MAMRIGLIDWLDVFTYMIPGGIYIIFGDLSRLLERQHISKT